MVARITHVLKFSLLGVAVFACVLIISQLRLSDYFPIKKVRVYGISRIDKQEVQEVVAPLVNHGFFGIRVDYIRDRLMQEPWVADIFVRRNWPDQVEVTVIEREALALWNDNALLSTTGVIFTPKSETYPMNIPKFSGPDGKQMMMLDYFSEINRILIPLHAKISYLELTPYFTWKMTLDNGIVLQIGHKDILTRLNHFVKVYPKIVGERTVDVDSIDLRYPNGVAVRWKTSVKES